MAAYIVKQKLRNRYITVTFSCHWGKETMEIDTEKAKIEVERLKKKESAIRETRQNLEALLRTQIHCNALRTKKRLETV